MGQGEPVNQAVIVGLTCLLTWNLWISSTPARAQGGWPPGPPGGVPVQPACGGKPPEIEDPSPGDSTPCWEYVSSSGWNQLFNCVGTTNCPTAEAQGGQQGDCACLNFEPREDKQIIINGPYWDVTPGSVVFGPDDPDCGDPDTTPIDPEESPWWEAESDNDGVAIASPEIGVGENADFTVFAAMYAGECKIQITWHLGLEMDGITTCPTNFTQQGPTVDVTVYEIKSDFPETGDCPDLVPVEFSYEGFGKTPEPTLKVDKLDPLQLCDDGGDCDKWRITGGVYLELGQGWYRTHNKVEGAICSQPGGTLIPQGTLIPRSIDAVGRTVAHEMKHCEKAREDIQDINDTMVEPETKIIYSSRRECENRIASLKAEIQAEWERRWGRNECHCYHVGDPKYEADECGGEEYVRGYVCGDW